MSKLSIKKIIMLVVIAVGAVACFAMPNIISSFNIKSEPEQILDIGLEYKNGWYLINSAEDYYTMCEYTSVGATPGAKYKLTKNITIDSGKAKNQAFLDATFDGCGYEIKNTIHPEYVQPENFTMDYVVGTSPTSSFQDWRNTYGVVARYAALSPQGKAVLESGIEGNKNISFSGTSFTAPMESGYYEASLWCYGGLYGTLGGTIKNIYFTYTGSVEITTRAKYSGLLDHYRLGGLVGWLQCGTISNCVVRYENGSSLSFVGPAVADGRTYVDAFAGMISNGSTINNCLVVYGDSSYGQSIEPYNCTANTQGDGITSDYANFDVIDCYKASYSAVYGASGYNYIQKSGLSGLANNIATTLAEIEDPNCTKEWIIHKSVNGYSIYPREILTPDEIEDLEPDPEVDFEPIDPTEINVIVGNLRNTEIELFYSSGGNKIPVTPFPYNEDSYENPDYSVLGYPEYIEYTHADNAKAFKLKGGDSLSTLLSNVRRSACNGDGEMNRNSDFAYKIVGLGYYDFDGRSLMQTITSSSESWNGKDFSIFGKGMGVDEDFCIQEVNGEKYYWIHAIWQPVEYELVWIWEENGVSVQCEYFVEGHHKISQDDGYTMRILMERAIKESGSSFSSQYSNYNDYGLGGYAAQGATTIKVPSYAYDGAIICPYGYWSDDSYPVQLGQDRTHVILKCGPSVGASSLQLRFNENDLPNIVAQSTAYINSINMPGVEVIGVSSGGDFIGWDITGPVGTEIPLPTADHLVWVNMHLVGWNSVGRFTANIPSNSATLYAQFYAQQMVEFHPNGGSWADGYTPTGSGDYFKSYKISGAWYIEGVYSESVTLPGVKNITNSEGATLLGWDTDGTKTSDPEFMPGSTYTFNEKYETKSVALFAVWGVQETWDYTIILDAGGGTWASGYEPYINHSDVTVQRKGSQIYIRMNEGDCTNSNHIIHTVNLPYDGVTTIYRSGYTFTGWSHNDSTLVNPLSGGVDLPVDWYPKDKFPEGGIFIAQWSYDDSGDPGGGGGDEPLGDFGGNPNGEFTLYLSAGGGYWVNETPNAEGYVIRHFSAGETVSLPGSGHLYNGNMVLNGWDLYGVVKDGGDSLFDIYPMGTGDFTCFTAVDESQEWKWNVFATALWYNPAPPTCDLYLYPNGGTIINGGYLWGDYYPSAYGDGFWRVTEEVGTLVDFPTETNLTKPNYTLVGWSTDQNATTGVWATYIQDAYYYAIWAPKEYRVELDASGGTTTGPSIITYTILDGVAFGSASRLGYTFLGWEFDCWLGEPGALQMIHDIYSNYAIGFTNGSYGDARFKAEWAPNKYQIVLHGNGGADSSGATSKNLGTFTYAEVVPINWTVTQEDNVFIGWARQGYTSTQDYSYIYENNIEHSIVGQWGSYILNNGNTVTQITDGNADGSHIVDVYAIWLPVYKLIINTGGASIYERGELTDLTEFTLSNTYITENRIYTPLESEIFNMLADVEGYRLHKYGHYISGWQIAAKGNGDWLSQYYVPSNTTEPMPTDWVTTTDITKLVLPETNIQYLQGDIIATPMWEPLTVDVILLTNSGEAYKDGYTGKCVSEVTFNSRYIISTSTDLSIDADIAIIEATDILGYSIIHAYSYNDTELKNGPGDPKITLQGTWNYEIPYRLYSNAPTYGKSTGWFVEIEGYYSPDLYRLKVDLQLPYSATVEVDSKGFTSESVNLGDLQKVYAPVVLDINSGEYIISDNYTNRQNKLYKVDSSYYIYLLQDQKIENGVKYNIYRDGAIYNGDSGVELPTFDIPYYTMHYFYTLNDESIINLYQMAELTEEQINDAKLKIGEKHSPNDIIDAVDWKYEYCNTNETLNDSFALKIYWYRNIVNLQINNILNEADTFAGYAIIEEIEQVSGTILKDHRKYYLVIYTQSDDTYSYVTFGFDDISVIYSASKYQFDSLKDKSGVELAMEGCTKQSTNTLQIFFGNSFKIYAIDQSKDCSMDEFIGYRFDNYSYDLTSDSCTKIDEIDTFINDGTNYEVAINLQNYEQGINGNTTNYFKDKETLQVNVNFKKIEYVFNYQVTDTSNNVNDKYGSIRLEYKLDLIEGYQFTYNAVVDNENNFISTMRVRLGSELYEWRLVNDIIGSEYLTDNQIYRMLLNATFLRNYLYTNEIYSSTPVQQLGDLNAVCGDIEFDIHVNVKNVNDDTIIREYLLKDTNDNLLFTLSKEMGGSVTTVSIDNNYLIKMLTRKADDTFLYYYQDDNGNLKQYALRGLYIAYSLAHSTNKLVNTFDYPVESLADIPMSVNYDLLDWCINYEQFVEVSPSNRVLEFYIEVSPMATINFEIKTNENDRFKESRTVYVSDVPVATATEGLELSVLNSYLGFVSEETLLNFIANDLYYSEAKLTIDYVDEKLADSELNVSVNSNVRYMIIGDATITIELLPKTYQFDAVIEYNGTEYSTTQYAEVTNASGINIFNEVNGIVIKNTIQNIDPTTGTYYLGDVIHINYNLNEGLSDDFDVTVYCNGSKLNYDNNVNAYVAEFEGTDIKIVICVEAKAEVVTLTTNFNNKIIADIYGQVNNGEMIRVEDVKNNYKQFELVNGDVLNIYIKANVGYKFSENYVHKETLVNVTPVLGEGTYEGYLTFTMFATGFNLSQVGWYYLMFEQVAIDIEFKYYVVSPSVEEDTNAGQGYTYSYENFDKTTIIKEGSTIKLNRGVDNLGYRFDGYSYVAPKGVELSKEFDLTDISSTQQQFVMEGEVLTHLSGVEINAGNKIVLTVYINYVKQYTFNIVYADSTLATTVVRDNEGNKLYEGRHYDYNKELYISAKSVDSAHYQISVVLDNGIEEIINTSNKDSVGIISGSEILTNLDNLAGFEINRRLTNNYTIVVDTIVERYNTILNQNLYHKVEESDEPNTADLITINNGEYFKLYGNIYYQVSASHQYGTEVEINIFILKPSDKEQQYYTITKAMLDGANLSIEYLGEGIEAEAEGYYYRIIYKLEGDELPTELVLDIDYKALYYLELS